MYTASHACSTSSQEQFFYLVSIDFMLCCALVRPCIVIKYIDLILMYMYMHITYTYFVLRSTK